MRIRQTRVAPSVDLYWIDVQRPDGTWHEMYIPHPLRRVKAFRRFMAQEDDAR